MSLRSKPLENFAFARILERCCRQLGTLVGLIASD